MTEQQVALDDILDDRRRAIEDYLEDFRYLDDRVGDAITNIKYGELDLPKNIARDLEEIDMALTRVRYWLEDQFHELTI